MRFLIVSRDESRRRRIAEGLRARSFAVDEMLARGDTPPDRIVLDVTSAASPGAAMVPLVRDHVAAWPDAQILVLAPFPSASLMHIALRLGAVHCIAYTDHAVTILGAFAEAEAPVDSRPPAEVTFATLDEARWAHIGRALDVSGGNISGAARLLGIHRQSLQRILRSRRAGSAEIALDA